MAANEMGDQVYVLRVAEYAEVGGIEGTVFLHSLGLIPERALPSAGALVAFYVASLALAFGAAAFASARLRHGRGRGGGGGSGPLAALRGAARRLLLRGAA
jgi:hypothetical protein